MQFHRCVAGFHGLGVCFIFLLAYGFGAPLLYSGTFIPPSLPTILAFSTMGLALLILARRSGGLFRRLPGGDFQPAFIFVLIFFLLAMGIVVTGYAYYRNFERHFRVEAEQQLAAIAELKVGELAQYRKERLGDAFILHNNPAFTQLARRFLESPADADAQRQLQAWLGKYQIHYQYNQVFLLDAQGGVRMSVPESPVPMSALISSRTAEVLRSGQPVFQDFYRHESSHRIYLSLMVPIHDEADGNRPLGVVVLRIDPTSYLYPFIRRWPMPSGTAETLLVRREGNEVVFLNELRFQTNTVLNVLISLANTNVPAVKAVLGQEGIVAGSDYRGVPVLAAVRAVPDSPWFLVARRDVAEVYAPLRAQLWKVIALVGVLLFSAGAGVSALWRQQLVRFYRDRAESAEALRESEVRFRQLADNITDVFWITSPDFAIMHYVSPGFERIWGRSVASLYAQPHLWSEAIHPEEREQVFARLTGLSGNNPEVSVEYRIARPDGSIRWIYDRAFQVRDAAGKVIRLTGIASDITERKRAEVEIRELNRSLEQRVQERTSELIAANKELDAFAYAVSHDLRQPLRAMNGFSQILLEDHGASLPGEARKDLDEIILASRQMGELIDGLLRLSRSTLGEVRRDAVDISTLAARILAELAAGEPNRRVTWTVEPGMAVRGDERMIEVVLANLLGNAWKYTARQPVAKIEVGVMDQCCDGVAAPAQNANTPILHHSNTPVFFVCDNGAGFDMKHAARLFQPFQRLHREDEFPGIGIGLATVQRVVHRHGGTIRAAAAPGKGATFYFSLSSPDGKNKEEL